MPSQEREIVIESLAPGGDGVAHLDIAGERRAVFVAQSAPGDVLRVAIDASTRPARGRILELVAAGPQRVAPECAWASRCGGCDWMHVSLDAQASAHVEHVRAILPATSRHLPIELHPARQSTGYRSRARVHARADKRGRVAVGMHEARTHAPVEVERCIVLDPALEPVRRGLGALLEGSTGRGDVRLALGAGRLPVLDVEWDGDLAPAVFGRVERAVHDGAIAGARILLHGANRPARIGDPTPWVIGADGQPLQLAAGGFGQPSEEGSAELARHVASLAAARGADAGVELYAGAGSLTVLLTNAIQSLVAVESDEASVAAARANLAARGSSARVVHSDAERFEWGRSARVLVLDPPRTGARRVAERLASGDVPRPSSVIYVSCDPQTLGRDLALLAPAYEAQSVDVFQLFPQTSHVEAVVALTRRT
jgi:23S rRNA (uracil1939-C5)-methyltransferase